MNIQELKERLKKYKKEDIILTKHAEIQALIRQIDIEEVKKNIMNPEKLVYVKAQEKDKCDCYFAYSEVLCHRYILKLNCSVRY